MTLTSLIRPAAALIVGALAAAGLMAGCMAPVVVVGTQVAVSAVPGISTWMTPMPEFGSSTEANRCTPVKINASPPK